MEFHAGELVQYLFFLRIPELIALLLVALPIIAFTVAKGLLRGLFDLTPLSLFAVTLTCLAVAGTATMNASVILLHAGERFHLATGAISLSDGKWLLIMWSLSTPIVLTSLAFSIAEKHPLLPCLTAMVAGTVLSLGFSYGLLQAAHSWTPDWRDALRPVEAWMARTNLFAGYADLSSSQDPFPDHLRAAAAFASSLILYAILGVYGYFRLGRRRTVPALCSALMLVLVTGWMLSALTFFFDAWRFPVLLVPALFATLAAQSVHSDHFYQLHQRTSSVPAPDPAETIARTGAKRVIVVAASGGGIQAAAWTAQVLYGLREDFKEQFDQALRMISSVSGGSVGSVFFARWLLSLKKKASRVRRPDEAAAESSLDEVAWGLAWPDFIQSLLPWLFPNLIGRGRALEKAWSLNASQNSSSAGELEELVSGWNEEVCAGSLPGIVMNATIAESGERLLLATTGMEGGTVVGRARVDASEFHRIDKIDFDTSLVTAARLSATFPYVTPASRSDRGVRRPHVVDGGYYDNYGMATLVEWLDAALTGAQDKVESVLVIQIREVRIDPDLASKRVEKSRGWFYQALAPVTTLLAVRDAGQMAHNDIELKLLKQKWASKVPIQCVPFEFPKSAAPLSWHLTPSEVGDIRLAWEEKMGEYRGVVRQFLYQARG